MENKNGYPRALYTAVIEKLDDELREFFEEHKDEPYFRTSFSDAAQAVLTEGLNGRTDEAELRAYWANLRKQNNRKKKRWLNSLLANVDSVDPSVPHHPFHNIYEKQRMLKKQEWATLYGKKTIRDVMEEELESAKEWAANQNSRFIDFPALASFTPKRVAQAFETDVLENELRVMDDLYQLNLNDFLQGYVDEMSDSIFTDSRKKYEIPGGDKDFVKEIPMSEEDNSKMVLTVSREAFGEDAITLLDAKDQAILLYVIRKASTALDVSDSLTIPVREIASCMQGKNHSKPSARAYEDAERRCYKIANSTYNKFDADGRQVAAINFLSSAILKNIRDDSGRQVPYMDITLGSTLVNAISMNKIRYFYTNEYEMLENKLSRILYTTLQRERIRAYKRYKLNPAGGCSKTFTYSNWLSAVNFGSSNRRRNLRNVMESLEEFRDRKVMIDSYKSDGSTGNITVEFKPLTPDEENDLMRYEFGDENEAITAGEKK